ncbi:MAG: TRAP transporter large permease [Chloroflexi bacterium]|nr:TRAP transporter large permease [Chloroflexota bacterium]
MLLAFGSFFVLLALGTPIFVGIFLGAGLGLWIIRGYDTVLAFFSHSIHAILAQYFFAVLPLFILVGTLAEAGGLGVRAYEAFHKLVGHIRGGLLVSTTYAAAAFGACSGSSVASAALFTKIALPELRKYQYDEKISLGCIATAGSLAILIPPSGMMVIFGVLTETSVGRLLIGGILPGIVLAAMLGIMVYTMCRINPKLSPVMVEPASWPVRIRSLAGIWPVFAVFIVIIVSIYTGLVTPSEAAALGAVIVLLWNFIIRTPAKKIINGFREAVIASAQITILLVGGLMLSKVVAYSGIPRMLIEWIKVSDFSLPLIWGMLILMWIVLGMIIDSTSQLVLTLPFVFPVMTSLGVSPIVLGVVAIVTIEMGVITPPVGFNCYIVASLAGVDPVVAFKGIMPFFLLLIVATIVFILFPGLSTWLPTMAFG